MGWIKTASKGKVEKSVRESWVKLERNGPTGVLLLLSTTVTRELDLVPGDFVKVVYDKASRKMGVYKSATGGLRVSAHGANEKRLKISVTKFYNEVIGSHVNLPFRAVVAREKVGSRWGVTFTLKKKRAVA